MTRPLKTKAASDIKAGDWCVFGSLAYLAGKTWTGDGEIFIQWGNGNVSTFHPNERIHIEPKEEGS